MTSISTNVAPYFDDSQYAIDNNFTQILFKPGYAVQARELTQLQDILQNQISQLGEFVLSDGSPVTGGHISIDGTVVALQLQQQYANTDINLSDFFVGGNNTLIINASGATTVKAVVVGIDATQTNPVIIVKYLTGTTFSPGQTIQVATGIQSQATLVTANASSPASVASINYGVFYSGGYFVTVEPTTIVLSSSNSAPSCYIGLQIEEDIVTSTSDSTLLDPAQGSFNYSAPGADRLQYNLILSYRDFDSTDTSAFYKLVTVENGLITSQVDYPVLGTINQTLAKRTYDTSGDFVVKPFIATTGVNSSNANQYSVIISPGEAFVKGYEYQTVGTTRVYGDKALSTNTITDYSFSTEFGNILTVQNVYGGNVSGAMNIAGYQNVDLHVVTSGNIVNQNTASYNATKIGTGQVRDIEYLGLGDYYAYVLNLNITPNTFIAQAGNTQNVAFPAGFAGIAANAFANVLITVSTGPYVDNRTITSWNNTTRIAQLNLPLSTAANSTSNCTLNYAIKDLNSLVVQPSISPGNTYYTQNTSAALQACMDIATAGKDTTGNTQLVDTNFNCLVFPLPQSPITQGSITNASFYARSAALNQSFSNGSLTLNLTSGQQFPYGFTGYLTDQVASQNFLVIVRNALSSGLANGTILTMNHNALGTGGNGVYQVTNTQVIISTSAGASPFYGDVYYTVQQTSATTDSVRTKTLKGNSSNTILMSTDSPFNAVAVNGLTGNAVNNVRIDAANGYVWFMNPATMANTPGNTQLLYIPDVFNVIKVYDSGNTQYAPAYGNNLIDLTNNYYLNSGQTDNLYDFASLSLKAGCNAPTGQTVVMLQYFAHSSTTGFFDCDSYTSTVYANGLIPYYSSPAFGSFSLRDSIDFRPTRALGSVAAVTSLTLQGLELPNPNYTFILSYQFYLPRIDKLVLNKSGQFQIKQGVSSQYPKTPSDSADAMTLYIMSIPAYTPNCQQIGLQYVENKRYTMKDIGSLDARITQLEYYSTLSQLENQAANETILYQDGVTPKPQYGIIADDFGDYSIVDNQSTDLQCYLQQGTLSPFKTTQPLALTFSSNTTAYNQGQRTISLPYTEVPAITQNAATTAISVQPYLFAQFTGTCQLMPQTDYWFSSTLTPQIIQPPTSNPALPPLPAPNAAPALKPAANVSPPSVPIISSNRVDIEDFWVNPHSYYYNGFGGYKYTAISVGPISYGVVSPINNWFGTLTSAVSTATSSKTNIPATGSSIQLTAGSKITNSTTITPTQPTVL
jgi:hypothetical protein